VYLGGRPEAAPFLQTYVEASPAPGDEIPHYLGAWSRFRGAVQAAYFSMRVAISDRTGINDQADNWKGLRDAQHMLEQYGVSSV
jgi:hypothetical protein